VSVELTLGRKLARLATNAVLARPGLWRVFRPLLQAQFDRLAPGWDELRRPGAFAALEQALAAVPGEPKRVLDLGTGTGAAAFEAARRFPSAEVVGVDMAEQMLAQARLKTPPELAGRVAFQAADAERLPFDDGLFDLVLLANMIPFFDELARIVAPGGHVVFSFSGGSETPIWVSPERLRSELSARGFAEFADFEAVGATALLARKGDHA
jgi:ubiquinone/menaquinone biosynthesis C-methylase UbiE